MSRNEGSEDGTYFVLSVFVMLVTIVCKRGGIERVNQMSVLPFLFRGCGCGHGRNDTIVCAKLCTGLHIEHNSTPSVPTSKEDGDIAHVIVERTVLYDGTDYRGVT